MYSLQQHTIAQSEYMRLSRPRGWAFMLVIYFSKEASSCAVNSPNSRVAVSKAQ